MSVMRKTLVPLALVACSGAAHAQQVPTTIDDFFIPGTQPNALVDPLTPPQGCRTCHGNFNVETEPYTRWNHSMMGQAGRDPIFYAALAIANQDVNDVGELCLRCHTPMGWLNGRSVPTDGSALMPHDRSGVACIVCHRMVNPVYTEGESPAVDQGILAALSTPVVNPHSGSMVIDPHDRRRGPLDLGDDFFYHQWLESPFHKSASLCATCHDVSNPAYSRQIDGTYALNDLGQAPPSNDKYQQFPVERTYSEWLMSDFAVGPVDVDGRFGGTLEAVSTCQDCHMPEIAGQVCAFGPSRTNIRQHNFAGANTWVLRAIDQMYPVSETGLDPMQIEASIQRNIDMLRAAADLELSIDGSMLNVRIINQSGHKLPTGYAEGRRMWINARFYGDGDSLISEAGAYDQATATLDTASTKVYEGKMGITQSVSDATGVPAGESFHFALNNTWVKDNRIPPRGFTNANFAAIQASHVGYSYVDGQHWDDTLYAIPEGATRAEVAVYFQTTSREYIEFLRDHNTTNNAGQEAYDLWADPLIGNKSAPVSMVEGVISIGKVCTADLDASGGVNLDDFSIFIAQFGNGAAECIDGCSADLEGDNDVDLDDFSIFIAQFGNVGCVTD